MKGNKKWYFIGIAIIVTIIVIAIICIIANNSKSKKLDYSTLELGQYLPKIEKDYGEIGVNRKDTLWIKISKVKEEEYKAYAQKCNNEGYDIDIEDGGSVYGAFNKKGYNIRILYLKDKKIMDITLKSPEEMHEFEWPTTGLGSLVPATKSNYGRISIDNIESFIVHVGKTTISEYNEYVKDCQNAGYTVDYSKGTKTYSAKNDKGYELHLSYIGGDRIEVSVSTPEEKKDTETSLSTKNNTIPQENAIETNKPSEDNQTDTSKPIEENKVEPAKPTENNSTVAKTGEYSDANHRDDAEDTFLAEIRDNCPYGVKIHMVTGWLAKTYEGNGVWFFKVNVTVTNSFNAKSDMVAEGRVDSRNSNEITYFNIY